MTTGPEDRLAALLRDAFAAVADTVAPGSARELPGDLLGPRTPRTPRARWRGPGRRLTAAAATAAAVLAAILVPRALAGGPDLAQSSDLPPAFFAAVISQGGTSSVDIISTSTGRVVTQLRSPKPGTSLTAITRYDGDRTFLAAAEPTHPAPNNCGTSLWRIELASDGQVASTKQVIIQRFFNQIGPLWGLVSNRMFAASESGHVIAWEQVGCNPAQGPVYMLGGADIATGSGWSQGYGPGLGLNGRGLSMSADGSVASEAEQYATPSHVLVGGSELPKGTSALWVVSGQGQLSTGPPSVRVIGPVTTPITATISPSGSALYAIMPASAAPATGSTSPAASTSAATGSPPGSTPSAPATSSAPPAPPSSTPPASSPPASTPPASTPPASTPPVNSSAPVSSPPVSSSAPASTPASDAPLPGTSTASAPTVSTPPVLSTSPAVSAPGTATPAASAPSLAPNALVVVAYRTHDGRPTGIIATLPAGDQDLADLFVAADASGSSLLVSDLTASVDVVSTATGNVTVLPVTGLNGGRIVSVAW
jgi:hypothetical protein